MYLEVSPTGGKYWRFKYRFGAKERRLIPASDGKGAARAAPQDARRRRNPLRPD